MGLESKDLGIGRLRGELARLATLQVTIGVQGAKAREIHGEAGVPIGVLAAWNHYGTEHAPARPWIDEAISRLAPEAAGLTARAVSDLIDERVGTAEEAAASIGPRAAQAAVQAIEDSPTWAVPLAERTIRNKGHAHPLIDSGQLQRSQSYAVRDQSGAVLAEGDPL